MLFWCSRYVDVDEHKYKVQKLHFYCIIYLTAGCTCTCHISYILKNEHLINLHFTIVILTLRVFIYFTLNFSFSNSCFYLRHLLEQAREYATIHITAYIE